MMKVCITGEVFWENYSVSAVVHVPHELEKFIVESVWEVRATDENVHALISTALTAARAVFANPETQWNQVQQRADAKTAVLGAIAAFTTVSSTESGQDTACVA